MKYEELPSTAIDYMELDFDSSVVKVVYKSNTNKQYGYKCEDLEEFQSAFMILCGKLEAEQDRDDEDNIIEDEAATIEREDASIGKFINQRVQLGNLTLDYILEQTQDMTELGWDAFQGSTMPQNAVVVGDE